jgi:hypothetical protein
MRCWSNHSSLQSGIVPSLQHQSVVFFSLLFVLVLVLVLVFEAGW